MYLKTPKRYKSRKRYFFSLRWPWLWVLTPIIIVGGWFIYQNREALSPLVIDRVEVAYNNSQEQIATMMAPTPLPTENPTGRIERAHQNWAAGRVEDAMGDYETAVELAPNDLTTHYNMTMGLIMEGLYSEALEAAENTITASPFSSDAWAIRAFAQIRSGNPGGGIASGLHALELNPENPRALAFLTEAYLDTSQPERARETAEQAVLLDPNNAEAYYARGQVARLVDFDFEAARSDFETAYSLAPYLTDAAVDTAYLDWNQQNYQQGVDILTTLIESNPRNTNALYAMGFIYNSGLGNPERASDYLTRCIEVDNESTDCHYYLGQVTLRLQDFADAADHFARAVELSQQTNTESPTYYYWAGQGQIFLGNCPTALTFLRPGVELAREQGRADLVSDFQVSLRECQAYDTAPSQPSLPTESSEAGDPATSVTETPAPNL